MKKLCILTLLLMAGAVSAQTKPPPDLYATTGDDGITVHFDGPVKDAHLLPHPVENSCTVVLVHLHETLMVCRNKGTRAEVVYVLPEKEWHEFVGRIARSEVKSGPVDYVDSAAGRAAERQHSICGDRPAMATKP